MYTTPAPVGMSEVHELDIWSVRYAVVHWSLVPTAYATWGMGGRLYTELFVLWHVGALDHTLYTYLLHEQVQ